jgi:type IV pilus assembly protein PilA
MSYRRTSLARCCLSLVTALVLLATFAACSKKAETAEVVAQISATAPLVKGDEMSRHFNAVNAHIELGGTMYGYVDVDGDMLELAGSVQRVVAQLAAMQPQLSMFAKQDFKVLMTDLGLDDVKAIGLSSVHQASGSYRNRAFLYTPTGRHGLFAIFGGKPSGFVGTRLAPKDADFYAEHEFDIDAVYLTVKALITKVNGPEAGDDFEKMVKKAGSGAHFSLLDLLEGLNGRATLVVRLDPEKNITLPGPKPVKIPAFSILLRIDGIGSAIEPALAAEATAFVPSQEGSLHIYTAKETPPLESIKLVLAVDGKALYAATSPEFLHECLRRTEGLDKNPDFVSALTELGPDGNGLTWVSPRFFSRIKALPDINQDASPQARKFIDMYAASLPSASSPLLSVRTNLPDGILIRSTWNRSLKADVAMLTIYNPLTVGLVAAMAIPAFQKVRTESQAKAIMNNLRMLSAAADQHYLEKGVTTATYDDLVGPDKYVKAVVSVAGEDYHQLVFAQGRRLTIHLPDGRMFSYPMDPSQTVNSRNSIGVQRSSDDAYKRMGVVNNLKALERAANRYYEVKGVTTTTFSEIISEPTHPDIKSIMGEDYRSVILEKGAPVQVQLPDGRVVRSPVNQGPQPLIGKVVREGPVGPDNSVSAPVQQKANPVDAAIMENLRKLNEAANADYDVNGTTSVTLDDLVGPRKAIPELVPVAGEDYHSVLFKKGHPLRLFLKDGRTLLYPSPGVADP